MKITHYLAGLPRLKVMPRTVSSCMLWMREWKEKKRAEKRKKKRILLVRKNPYFTQYPKISHNKALVCQQQAGPVGNLSRYQVNVEDKGKSRKWQSDGVMTGKKGKAGRICWAATLYNSFTTHLNAYYGLGIMPSSEENKDIQTNYHKD